MQIAPDIACDVLEDMVEAGRATWVDDVGLQQFLESTAGVVVLLFAGVRRNRAEGHDVAVAVRELARTYRDLVRVGIVTGEAEDRIKQRFRVVVMPSVVLLAGGEVLEVLPRVRDWSDYEAAFRRYLGAAPNTKVA